MANLPSNILPIDIGPKPEARSKPSPARSRDPARFERHLDSAASERPQKPERPSTSNRHDTRSAERETPRASPDHHRARPASKPDRPNPGHNHRPDPPRAEQPSGAARTQGDESQTPATDSETPALAATFKQPAAQPELLPAENEPELAAVVQGEHAAPAEITDTPESVPEDSAGTPADDTVPQPGAIDRRPDLPEPALRGLRNAALNIPDHYSGHGRPGDPALILDAPAAPDDQPPAAPLPQDGTPPPHPLAGDPTGIIADPETSEPLAFELPDTEIAPVADVPDETLPGIPLPGPEALAPIPRGDQPVAVSSAAPAPDVPVTDDTLNPPAAAPQESTRQSTVAATAQDTTIAPTTVPTPDLAPPLPVADAQNQNTTAEPVPAQAGVLSPGAGDTPETPDTAPLRPANTTQPVQAAPLQQTQPQETARPVETPVSPAPAPQAARGSLARPDTGLLSQLADTDPAVGTPEPRPSLNPPGDDAARTISTYDKAAANTAAATPRRAGGVTANATPTAPPPLLAGGAAPADIPVTIQAAGEPQSSVPLQAQNSHNVSIRFGTSPQLGASAQTPVNTLAFNIAKNFDNGVTRFQVRIDPPELGRVDVKLDMTVEGRVQAHLTVERSETLELMMRDARSLEKALADTGLTLDKDSLSFSLKDQNASPRQDSGPGTENTDTATPDGIDHPLPDQMTRGYISDTGVDITV